jgi:sialate O-acetylesterase
LQFGQENTLAVRVYDQQLGGGIVRGRIGIYEAADEFQPDFSIAGLWKFSTGDDPSWSRPEFDDRKWQNIYVPAFWETYGMPEYDGFGWYRTKFILPANLVGARLILLLGKIDDLDETYLNGRRIGRTGTITSNDEQYIRGDEYNTLRAYTIPNEILGSGGENTLAVRVYDGRLHGGIYRGPLGIATRERFREWQRHLPDEKKGNWLQKTLEYFLK